MTLKLTSSVSFSGISIVPVLAIVERVVKDCLVCHAKRNRRGAAIIIHGENETVLRYKWYLGLATIYLNAKSRTHPEFVDEREDNSH